MGGFSLRVGLSGYKKYHQKRGAKKTQIVNGLPFPKTGKRSFHNPEKQPEAKGRNIKKRRKSGSQRKKTRGARSG